MSGPSLRRIWIAYLGASFSIGVFSAFNNFTLTLWLSGMTSSYLVLGLMGNTRSFEGAIVSPLFGTWSDRTWLGWLGRRRPYILIGGLLSAILLAATPYVSALPIHLPEPWPGATSALLLAIVSIFLFTIAFNSMDDLHKALLADITRPKDRNMLSGLNVAVDMAGQVSILVLGFVLWSDGVPDNAFVLTGVLIAVGMLVTVSGVSEPKPAVWLAERQGDLPNSESGLSFWKAAGMYRGAVMLCVVQFAYWSGLNAVLPLVSVYTRDILGASVGQAQLLPGLMLLVTTVLAIPMGKLGDRLGKRRVLTAGYAVMGVVALGGLMITSVTEGAVLFTLAGVGSCAIMVITLPLLADLVPLHHMGTATGALAASGSVAAPLASLLAGQLADAYGPRAIFGLMAGMVVLAMVFIPLVRPPQAAEIASSEPPGTAGVPPVPGDRRS
jgi:maltose/moltooligosaccharide transporter